MEKVPGDLESACERMPTFTRMPFGPNQTKDVIVRDQSDLFTNALPITVVSKSYVLVQHREVLGAALRAFAACGIRPGALRPDVFVSESGARMAARVALPGVQAFDPGDGHEIDLTFECFNSVDRTVPLFALVGWFRLVCTNGLMVGTAAARFRQRHTPPLDIREFADVLQSGIAAATEDRLALSAWRSRSISRRALAPWVDGPVAETWGALAASRVHHIARTGFDGVPQDRFERVRPHERAIDEPLVRVPGAPERSQTLFDVAQVLSWVASSRDNFQQRLTWRAQIPVLVQRLAAA
jgi:hypothetical protein